MREHDCRLPDHRHLAAAWYGLTEFRSDWTRHYDYPAILTYDRWRDRAHALTLRHYDPDFVRVGALGKRDR
jgi:hypothetical protein